jgi:hypothetical protein
MSGVKKPDERPAPVRQAKSLFEISFHRVYASVIQTFIMRSFYILLAVLAFTWNMAGQVAGPEAGVEIRLTNGDFYRGQPVSFNEEGVVLRLPVGGFSHRINWSQMTQETLRALAKDPRATRFAEAFIELTPEEIQRERQKKEIVIQPVPRVEPVETTGFFAAFNSPAGWLILAVLYLGNLYAALEIANLRNRAAGLVIPVAAVLPVIGPIIFLAMPPGGTAHVEAGPSQEEQYAPAPAMAQTSTGRKTTAHVGVPSGGGLSIAQARGTATAAADSTVYKRGDFTFNRRFFEAKFPGFFRVVPGEAEKDLVLVIRGFKNDYIAKRISRISSNELHVLLLRGGTEVMVPFAEINEVQLRHKDAKA